MTAAPERPSPGFVAPRPKAPPRGCTWETDRDAALHALEAVTPTRADAAANRRAILRVIYAGWHDPSGQFTGGHAAIGRRAGLSRSCVGAHMRAMEAAGVLQVVQLGSSKAVNGRGKDIAPTYMVAVPVVLPEPEQAMVDALAARLAEPQVSGQTRHHPVGLEDLEEVGETPGRSFSGENPSTPIRVLFPERFAPRTNREIDLAVEYLLQLLRLPARYRRDVHGAARRFLRAGWTAEAVLRAVMEDPAGNVDRSGVADGALRPAAVLITRLGRWEPSDTPPVPARAIRRGPNRALHDQPPAALPERPAPTPPPVAALALAAAAGLRIGAGRG